MVNRHLQLGMLFRKMVLLLLLEWSPQVGTRLQRSRTDVLLWVCFSVLSKRNIIDLDKTMEEINEQTENMKQILERVVASPMGATADFDEDEVEAELEELAGVEYLSLTTNLHHCKHKWHFKNRLHDKTSSISDGVMGDHYYV